MKRLRTPSFIGTARALALALTIALSFTLTVFAEDGNGNWSTYQGNPSQNGQITTGTPPTATPTTTAIPLPRKGSPYSGIDTEPIMYNDGTNTWAFAIYNGGTYSGSTTPNANGIYTGTGGARLAVVNCSNNPPKNYNTYALSTTSGFQLSTPYLDTSSGSPVLYAAVTDFFDLFANDEFTTNSDWTLNNATIDTVNQVAVVSNATGTISQTVNTASSTNIQLTSKLILAGGTTANYAFTAVNGSTTYPLASGTITSSTSPVYINQLCTTQFPASGNYTITLTVTSPGAMVNVDYIKLNRQSAPSIKKITNLTSSANITSASVGGASFGGQINTPIVKYGSYLYYGTYNGNNKYYQLNPSTGATNIFTGNGNFYWAGAYSDGNFVYFGGDGGYLYYLPVGSFAGTASSSNTVTLSGAGNVRSSISTDGTSLYFTSQSGYLWKAAKAVAGTPPTAPTTTSVSISACVGSSVSITSTPTLSKNGYIYTGYYNGFTSGGVVKVPTSNFTQAALASIYTGDPVQCSPVVYSVTVTLASKADDVYFTTNSASGAGYCVEGLSGTQKWTAGGTSGNKYALQGFASANGYLAYGDDGGCLYVIH